MLKNYIKIAFRNLKRQRLFTTINILSLAIGMALFTLATVYSNFNFSFNRSFPDAENIYTITRITPSGKNAELHSMFTLAPLAPALEKKFPEIRSYTRYISNGKQIFKYGDKKFIEERLYTVDANFLDFFSLKLIKGNPASALNEISSIVVRKETAEKYFGDKNPIGETVTIGNDREQFKITGVLDDLPLNSSLEFDFLLTTAGRVFVTKWEYYATTFIKLNDGADPIALQNKFDNFIDNSASVMKESKETIYLFPLVDIYLDSMGITSPFLINSAVQFYLIMVMAIALLIIVSINFMNLATAKNFNRAKEVGLRKVVGAGKGQLVQQFLGESMLLAILSFPLAIVLYEIIHPPFAAFIGGKMDLDLMHNIWLLPLLFLVSIVIGLVSGSYPAFFLSSFKPAQVLKSDMQKGKKKSLARKILVVSQFTLTTVLIIITLVSNKQMDFLLSADLGYNRDNVIALPVYEEIESKMEALKTELLQNSQIKSVSASCWYPVDWGSQQIIKPEGFNEDESILMNAYPVNYDYFETLNMEILKGRSFSQNFNDKHNFIISEKAAKNLGWTDPIGKTLTMGNEEGTIIGVAKEFHFNHVFMKVAPSVLYLQPEYINLLLIKTASNAGKSVQNYIRKKWTQIIPEAPFESKTLENYFSDNVRSTLKIINLFNLITIFSIFLSVLGLIGLASFTTEQRTKEIGIRKALGAGVSNIIRMLVSEFFRLVTLANILAIPVAWFISSWFLEFAWAYKTSIGVSVFIVGALLSIISALVSVIFQTTRAAIANPIESLRYE